MRKTAIYTAAALILASFIGISCQKEMSETAEVTPVTVIGTIIDNSATKVSLTEGTNAIKTAWENNDNIIGWDESGNTLELKIDGAGRITDGGKAAIFTLVNGALPTQNGKKIYMIYAPGKTVSNLDNNGLTYNLSSQSDKVPALMTATGILTDGQIALTFSKVLALVAVKNPTLPVSEITAVANLKLSGNNVMSSVTIGKTLSTSFSDSGPITRTCNFSTAADGTSNVMEYFAVAPNSTSAKVTVSTVYPTGYEIIKTDASFAAGQCYVFKYTPVTKQEFTVNVQSGIANGTITTTPTSGSSVAWGTQVNVTANPFTGYELATLIYNDGASHDIKGSRSFPMPQSDVTVNGSFKKKDYTISKATVTHGSFTVKNGETEVEKANYQDQITVVTAPGDGYVLDAITVKDADGTGVTVTNSTFKMPAKDVTVTVTFKRIVFTVASGKTVLFARGNLYYNGTSWGFEDKQYYFRTYTGHAKCDGSGYNSSGTASGHWGLFGWVGASSSFTGIEAYGASTDPNDSKYGNVSGQTLKNDWGNISGLPSPPGAKWSTLTKDEWTHLLNNRTTSCKFGSTTNNNARYLRCKVDKCFGLMIFPDTFIWPTTVTVPNGSYINVKDLTWSSVPVYTSAQFEALEKAGVVFLPAAGYRAMTDVSSVGSDGNYWSSTAGDSSRAYLLYISVNNVNPAQQDNRHYGMSVRLVSVVQ